MPEQQEQQRELELEEAWRGYPRNLKDALQMDLFELIPVMGQVSRFRAGIRGVTDARSERLFTS